MVARIECWWWIPNRGEHSTWRNTTIGDIPTDGNVSGLFRHADGGDKIFRKIPRGEEKRLEEGRDLYRKQSLLRDVLI